MKMEYMEYARVVKDVTEPGLQGTCTQSSI